MSGQETRVNEFGVEVSRHRIFGWQDQDTFVRNGDLFQLVNGKDMQLGRAVFPPGSEYEMHRHPHEQFSVLLAGRLLLTVGNETREIGPGDCWYVPGDVEHGGQVLGDEPVVFLDVYSPATRWIIDMLNGPGIRRVPAGEQTTVVHNQRDDYDQYIGRAVPEAGLEASKWGNPFVLHNDSDAERERVLAKYRDWIVEQPELVAALGELRGLRLGCWCAPKPCHGDVLAELADSYGSND
jgi:quercetin dioxygenase-like cupin family protein